MRRLERLEAEIHAWATESEHAPVIQALQALKGVWEITAVTLVAEVGEFCRFRSPAQLMAYADLVPRGYSSIRFALGKPRGPTGSDLLGRGKRTTVVGYGRRG